MGIDFGKVASRIYEILKSYGYSIKMFSEVGDKVYDPEDAKFFYALPDQLMVIIEDSGEYSDIQMYMGDKKDADQIQSLFNSLRQTSTKFNLGWTVRNFGRSITPKDFADRIDFNKIKQQSKVRESVKLKENQDNYEIFKSAYGSDLSKTLKTNELEDLKNQLETREFKYSYVRSPEKQKNKYLTMADRIESIEFENEFLNSAMDTIAYRLKTRGQTNSNPLTRNQAKLVNIVMKNVKGEKVKEEQLIENFFRDYNVQSILENKENHELARKILESSDSSSDDEIYNIAYNVVQEYDNPQKLENIFASLTEQDKSRVLCKLNEVWIKDIYEHIKKHLLDNNVITESVVQEAHPKNIENEAAIQTARVFLRKGHDVVSAIRKAAKKHKVNPEQLKQVINDKYGGQIPKSSSNMERAITRANQLKSKLGAERAAEQTAKEYGLEKKFVLKRIQESSDLNETTPPGQEDFVEDPEVKKSFRDRYGDRWEEVLYATAWDRHNQTNESDDDLDNIVDRDYFDSFIDDIEHESNKGDSTENTGTLSPVGSTDVGPHHYFQEDEFGELEDQEEGVEAQFMNDNGEVKQKRLYHDDLEKSYDDYEAGEKPMFPYSEDDFVDHDDDI